MGKIVLVPVFCSRLVGSGSNVALVGCIDVERDYNKRDIDHFMVRFRPWCGRFIQPQKLSSRREYSSVRIRPKFKADNV